MAFSEYYRRLFRMAWQDTKSFFGWNRKTLVIPALFIAGALIYWWWQGAEAMTAQVIELVAFSLAPIGAFTILLFGYNCVMVPIRTAQKAQLAFQTRENSLQREIERLGGNVNETVELFYDGSYPFCRENIPVLIVEKQWIPSAELYRVGVAVRGNKTIENVEVSLIDLQESDGGPNKAIPSILSPMRSKKGASSAFDVNPSDVPLRYVDIFKWRKDRTEIEICYYNNLMGMGQPIPNKFEIHGEHYLTLQATGKNIPTQEFLFVVGVDKQDNLIFKPQKARYL